MPEAVHRHLSLNSLGALRSGLSVTISWSVDEWELVHDASIGADGIEPPIYFLESRGLIISSA